MRPIGFSTGSLAKGDFHRALQMLAKHGVDVIELSALREAELAPLLEALPGLQLHQYRHVSLHLPSRLETLSEAALVRLLLEASLNMPLIVHPDVITDFDLWRPLGANLCLENMDKRKPIGKTATQLGKLFDGLPEARLCFDIAHAHQVDPTMAEAREILRRHGDRLTEVHLSAVNSRSGHEPLNQMVMAAFQKLAPQIPETVPVIVESPVTEERIPRELELAQAALPSLRVPVPA